MDYIELIAIIILIAAIVFLVYYYIQTANEGNINLKEVLSFSPKKDDDTALNFVDGDADAEMKVYDLMLKADGIVGDNLIMKGSDNNEE